MGFIAWALLRVSAGESRCLNCEDGVLEAEDPPPLVVGAFDMLRITDVGMNAEFICVGRLAVVGDGAAVERGGPASA